MNTQHTPGPWTVESLDNVDFTVLGGKSGQVRVAVESSERDARLIAAAPDLLDALRALMALDVKGHQLQDRLQFSDAGRALLTQCRAAIARATRCDA